MFNRISLLFGIFLTLTFYSNSVSAQDLIVDGTEIELGGLHWYDTVQVINGGVIRVPKFNGTDKTNTGNLQIVATSIYVDATSYIVATGSGYQPVLCGDGPSPTADGGGAGGCSVRDSGGGGAHFGSGGRGTKDCPVSGCVFPGHWEEDCGNSLNAGGTACSVTTSCYNNDGLPTVAGQAYSHSIYEIEFGGAGGDKGCRDGDGFGCITGGAGGGRIVLAAVSAGGTGSLLIEGNILADGRRGCGYQNDSGGGGAGGSVLLVGDDVNIGTAAKISAAGGLGGNTQAFPAGECPPCAQTSGTCDDCGGGGGGGIISVLSGTAAVIDSGANFYVNGSPGGVCSCAGEAGGGAGELQLSGVYRGELCDGYDNDFDGVVDNGFGTETCGSGLCEASVDECTSGLPGDCVPNEIESCQAPITDTRSRFMVIVDTSGSMLGDLSARFTFGDGSAGHEGIDTNSDGIAGNDSRLYKAKIALSNVISAYIPDIDFGMARFAQGTGVGVNCQLAKSFECAGICCTYDNPTNNTGTQVCTVNNGGMNIPIFPDSPSSDACVNYAGSCGSPRRGADILVGFEKPVNQHLMWLDHKETNFQNDRTEGDHCDFASGGDCELRGTGPTPLADSLYAVKTYLDRTKAEDRISSCRKYAVILLTDGTETCRGNPVQAATDLRVNSGLETYVIGFSVLPTEEAALNQIANAGSISGTRNAFFVGNENDLAAALASIVADSIVYETCNDLDDNCNGQIDEDFPAKGTPCDDGGIGPCLGTGIWQCRADGLGVECVIDNPGATPDTEVCDGIDNDCDGLVDEGLNCSSTCVPSGPEVCDGVDNDCNGAIDEDDPLLNLPCGEEEGVCEVGQWICAGGNLVCVGGVLPGVEMCNGLDDNCDGEVDNEAPCPENYWCIQGSCRAECNDTEFPCGGGEICQQFTIDEETLDICMPGPCANCAPDEVCVNNQCVNLCEEVQCEDNETCVLGVCRDCHYLGCEGALICYEGNCITDPCTDISCDSGEYCSNGTCVKACWDEKCPDGTSCNYLGECVSDPCAEVECESHQYCSEGNCLTNPCPSVYCEPGTVCIPPGECVPNKCSLMDCPAGYSCVIEPDGNARCTSNTPPPDPEKILPIGGNGCSCQNAASNEKPFNNSFLIILLIFGAVLFRRGGAL
ncbi:hypothetical protein KKF34_08565 [Myxococcota bacterium]|nr:hypothetical protein [Myxococcota bacterium]MBU1496916.1 hypothetical protein [Myxococcota bacterium]